jgi:FtsP/CotA-like multicopper oxidase with cupredoxin domain
MIDPHLQLQHINPLPTRRQFLRGASFAAASLAFHRDQPAPAQLPNQAPDYTIEISEIEWELSQKKKIRTSAYNGQIPGKLLRVTEGKPVAIEILNRLDREEIVHPHGQWIPVEADGAMEEGSPMIPAGGRTRIAFTPRPSGLHWYHTHAMAGHSLKLGLFTGQSGILLVAPRSSPAPYDLNSSSSSTIGSLTTPPVATAP